MRVLITGASGFVGLNVAEALLARGDEVVLAADRAPPAQALAVLPEGARVERLDVTDQAAVDALLARRRPQAVIHGAAVTLGAAREAEGGARAVAVNVGGTVNVVTAAAKHGVRRLLALSSASVYGRNAFGPKVLDEVDTPPLPESVYAVTKHASEKLALRLGEALGLEAVAARLGTVYGPWEYATGLRDTLSPAVQALMLARRGEAAVLPRPGRRDWVYAREVAGALAAMLDAERLPSKVYNVGLGGEWPFERWCALLAEAFAGFSWRVEPGAANVDFHGDADRAPLAVARLKNEVGYAPRYDPETAFADYRRWLDAADAFVAAQERGTLA